MFIMLGCEAEEIQIFVSQQGDSKNDGSKDAPFSKIEEAIEHAKEIKATNTNASITITILPGDYYLSQPLIIPASLSGLTLMGESSAQVTIKGSRPLDLKWEKIDDNIVEAQLDSDIFFDQFFVNNIRQTIARYPNYNEEGGYWQGHAADAISVERVKSWQHPEGAIFHAMHKGRWGGFHYRITGVDSLGAPILEGGYQNNRPSPPHDTYRMVENVLEELNSPGEWYLDKENRKLYYWPEANVDLTSATFEGSLLENLVSIQGDEENPVRNITIKGITFENTQRTFMNEYEQLLRSDWSIFRGGAVFIEGAEDCSIQQCEFVNLGGNVIFVSGYNRQVSITENHIHDCGASGISFVGEPDAVRSPSFQYSEFVPVDEMDTLSGPRSNEYPKDCLVENNLVYRIGRVEKQTAGVQIAMAMNITVRSNSIYDVPRAGINIGDGTWGGHVLEYNDVFNTVLETSDHGAFNSWGRDRFWLPNRNAMDSLTMANRGMTHWDAIETTIIRNNRFRCDHGWDIDLDDGSTNYYIYNNLCLNGGLKLREGFDRVVENNIMVNNGFHPHVWFKNSEDVFRNNIVMKNHQDVMLRGLGKEVDYNLFTNDDALKLSQSKGTDAASLFGDPMFVDPEKLDYTVAENSPALQIGFKNFPMDKFGVQTPALKKLAKRPEVPVIDVELQGENLIPNSILWLGMKVKSIETMEEQSASGLNEISGVIVLKVMDRQAQRLGVREGDVILKIGEVTIQTIDDLQKVDLEKSKGLKMKIFRDQVEKINSIR